MSEITRDVDYPVICAICGEEEWYIDPQHANDNGWSSVHEEHFCSEHEEAGVKYRDICNQLKETYFERL